MKSILSSKPILYATAAFILPLASLSLALLWQSVSNRDFWQSLGPEESTEGALMALGQLEIALFALIVGCIGGIALAINSVRIQRRVFCIGSIAVIFNGLPLLLWLIALVR